MQIYYVAAFCGPEEHKWFSPGRARKIQQVLEHLSDEGHKVIGLNIAPRYTLKPKNGIVDLCSSSFVPLRYLQILFNTARISVSILKPTHKVCLWLYNTRTAEAIVAIVALILRPELVLVVQMEDLPSARKANSGFVGILDRLTTSFLSNKASHVFAVSPQVASAYCRITQVSKKRICILPPALHPDLIKRALQRQKPFQSHQVNILYAGSYGPDNGVADLINAYLRIKHMGCFRLTLLGPAPCELILQYGQESGITFYGVVPNTTLFDFYTSSDVIVNPHRKVLNPAFIFPFKLIETVASGALPLTTPVPGHEVLGLPTDCIILNPDCLAEKLSSSQDIWASHADRLTSNARAIHDTYAYARIQEKINQELNF